MTPSVSRDRQPAASAAPPRSASLRLRLLRACAAWREHFGPLSTEQLLGLLIADFKHKRSDITPAAARTLGSEAEALSGLTTDELDDALRPLPAACGFVREDRLEALALSLQHLREGQRRECLRRFDRLHKIAGDDLIAATQLFTPRCIADFLIQNSLGTLWLQMHPESALRQHLPFYRVPPEDEPPTDCREPEDITLLDPACGSGLLLLAAVEIFERIYRDEGRPPQAIPELILRHNLRGIDIDPTALRLTSLLLHLHLGIAPEEPGRAAPGLRLAADPVGGALAGAGLPEARLIVANPPYLGHRKMDRAQADWISRNYPRASDNLAAAFLYAALDRARDGIAFIMPKNWLALSRYADLRRHFLSRASFRQLLELGAGAFPDLTGEVVLSCAFTARIGAGGQRAEYAAVDNPETLRGDYRTFAPSDGSRLPGSIICPELRPTELRFLLSSPKLGSRCRLCQGLATGDNTRFVRCWWQVDHVRRGCRSAEEAERSGARWFPYNKGGESTRWHGRLIYVVDWQHGGEAIRHLRDTRGRLRSRPQNLAHYFRPSVSWNKIMRSGMSARAYEAGFIFDMAGPSLFCENEDERLGLLAWLNSRSAARLLRLLSPTINTEVGQLAQMPAPEGAAVAAPLARRLVSLTRELWQDDERSMEFTEPALLRRAAAMPGATPVDALAAAADERLKRLRLIARLEAQNDALWARLSGVDAPDTDGSSDPSGGPASPYTVPPASEIRAELLHEALSYLIACSLGRYGEARAAEDLLTELFGTSGAERFSALTQSELGLSPAAYEEKEFLRRHRRLYGKATLYGGK